MSFDIAAYRALYPFTSRWLDRGGLRLHYVDEGAGDPLVMVHGNPTWSFFFRDLIAEFCTAHRCVALDHIGCGLSDKPGDDGYEYTLERRVADLEALIAALDLDRITFIVHDWGGMIGLAAALRRWERVARVVVLNTAGFLLPAGRRLPPELWLLRNVPALPALLVRGFNLFARSAARICSVNKLPPAVRAAYLGPYDSWDNRIATLRFVQDIPLRAGDPSYALAHWVDQNLYRLSERPLLICWGLRDFVFSPALLEEWQRRFPGAEVHPFEDAGHYILEDVGPQVIDRLRRFLSREPVRAGAARTSASPVS
jgi:haloalkane dehalogenase